MMKWMNRSKNLYVFVLIVGLIVGCAKVQESDKVLHRWSSTNLNKGELDRAIADYSKVIALNPENNEAYYNRGIAYYRKGQYDKAISDYDKAIELNPKDFEAYYNRGLVFLSKGRYDQAISDYDKAIEINSSYAAAYNNRGVAYFYIKDYDNSWRDINKAQGLGYPTHPEFLRKLSEASGAIIHPQTDDFSEKKTESTRVTFMADVPSDEVSAPAAKPEPTPQSELHTAAATSPKIKPSAEIENEGGRTVRRESWLLSQDAAYYTIQIMSHHNEAFLLNFIKKNQLLKQNEIAYYQYTFNHKTWYRLLYGIYPTKKEARLAVNKLSENIRKAKPWIRGISTLQKDIRDNLER